MRKKNIMTFRPKALDKMYLERIADDTGLTGSKLLRFVIREYITMQYGEDTRREIRTQYIERTLNND